MTDYGPALHEAILQQMETWYPVLLYKGGWKRFLCRFWKHHWDGSGFGVTATCGRCRATFKMANVYELQQAVNRDMAKAMEELSGINDIPA